MADSYSDNGHSSPDGSADRHERRDHSPAVTSTTGEREVEVEDDETVTMIDVLNEEEEMEENAFAVLAGSDDKHCTYLRGYVCRQAIYACNTCQTIDGQSAGICLACSYNCHDGHDLFELYTKRNFRCDCGNAKFIDTACKLYRKSDVNEKNAYNDNFKGLYCSCKRPYPDPDNDVDDEMIQCIVCEDWHHERHLVGKVPENGEFAEMICSQCMVKLPFLWSYYASCGNSSQSETGDVTSSQSSDNNLELSEKSVPNKSEKLELLSQSSPDSAINEFDSGIENSCDSAMSVTRTNGCAFAALATSSQQQSDKVGATFWSLSWRKNLCRCVQCMSMYSTLNCAFLVNEKDMVHYYENEGMQANIRVSHYDKGISELKKMNRTQQIEYITGYNNLKEELTEYLKTFANSNKVVRKEDIDEFFEEMRAKKKPRIDGPQFYCK